MTNARSSYLDSAMSRRTLLTSVSVGLGHLAFATMAQELTAHEGQTFSNAGERKRTHFPARATRVIFLCMNGGPSQLDLFDYKPELRELAPRLNDTRLLPTPFKFSQHGESGLWFSELLPELASHADDLCFIHSMHTDLPNHAQAFLQMHTGSFQAARPSLGAWALYGLGSENDNLPGFISINPPSENGGAQNYGSAFLPAAYQGTKIGTRQIPQFYRNLLGVDSEPGPPLKNIRNDRITKDMQRRQIDLVRDINKHKLAHDVFNPEVEGAIQSFETAFRMQDEIPGLMDFSSETKSTLQQYGIGSGTETDRFGRQCLLARRLAESGVRFIEVTSPHSWDHHFRIGDELPKACSAIDRPIAALLTDLGQRGLLEDTLVIWAGEFGRTPTAQSGTGRDHNNKGFTLWMAGGGLKSGLRYGRTDELGHKAVENPVHIHDWHATILHLLGFDHTQLTFNYAGRDFRLTDVHGHVVEDLINA